MRKRISISLLLIIAVVYVSRSQDNQFQIPIPRTPNAASLGKYGDIPVSYHTGVPNISIPIYTVKEGNLTLPISFSYHSSGIKINETASWVGLGWTLNAGGMISRTVIGGRDEGITSGTINNSSSDEAGWGWYKDHGLLSIIENPSPYGPNGGMPDDDSSPRSYHKDAAKGLIDTEPDIFTYRFGNYSGKFLFDDDRTPYTIPREDLLIEPVNDEPNGDFFISWKITAPDGIKYYFGETGATEQNYTYSSGTGGVADQYNTATTWYLYKIESVNGSKWISLEYESEDYSVGDRLSHSVIIGDGASCAVQSGSITQANQVISVNWIKGKRLSKITTSSGNVEIDFVESSSLRTDLSEFGTTSGVDVNDEAKSLSEIVIKDKDDEEVRKFLLDTDYFTSSASSSYPSYSSITHDTKRLRLNSIQETNGNESVTKPAYEFSYNSNQMARRFSLACDYWGYYNGADSNQGLIPNGLTNQCNQNTLNGGSDRSVDEDEMKSWILTKIDYPTGGSVEFAYEAHEYDNGDPALVEIGGLRIDSITKSFGNGQPDIVINYEYDQARLYTQDPYKNSNGFFWQDPDNNSQLILDHGGSSAAAFGEFLNATPQSPLYSTQGFHIGYMSVKETYSNGGYNQYIYEGETFQSSWYFPKVPTQNPIGKGQLTTTYQKSSNGDYDRYETNNYTTSTNDVSISAKKVTGVVCYYPHSAGSEHRTFNLTFCAVTSYSVKTRRHRILTKTSYLDGVTTTTNYTYPSNDSHGNPIATVITNSDGLINKTEFTYPQDAGSGAPVQMYDDTDSDYKHMTGIVIEQKELVDGSVASKIHNYYSYNSTDDVINLTSVRNYPSGSADYIETSANYDANDNLVSIEKPDGLSDSYIWGYENSFPIAKVDNASVEDVFYTGFEETIAIDGWPTYTSLVENEKRSGRYSLKSTNTTYLTSEIFHGLPRLNIDNSQTVRYKISGWVYSEGPSVEIHALFYDSGGTYISGDNISTTKTNAWVFLEKEIDVPSNIKQVMPRLDNNKWTAGTTNGIVYFDDVRFHPVEAQMTSYTYDPISGVTSQTDANNQTIHYDYDELGRLMSVRDSDGNLVKEVEYNYVNQ